MSSPSPKRASFTFTALLLAGAAVFGMLGADAPTTVAVTIRDHRFIPSEIRVPAGRAVILDVTNEDATAEEFDSPSLKVEKVIAGGKSGSVRIRPLDKGTYPFVGEYHQDTAQGVLIAD
jgi:plastocyanin